MWMSYCQSRRSSRIFDRCFENFRPDLRSDQLQSRASCKWEGRGLSKPDILIVDDDEAFCREVVRALGKRGVVANWTTSPSALFAGLCGTPDIVLLDLGMPQTDGFEVIEALSKIKAKPHIIVASGHSGRIIKAATSSAAHLGIPVLGALEKPYSILELISLLDRFCATDSQAGPDDATFVRKLVENGSLLDVTRVAFQAKYRLEDQVVVGHEALLRLDVERPISPELVFSDLVDLKVQMQLTEAVLRQTMQFASTLLAAGRSEAVSVNCSPALLCAPEFMPMLSDVLDDFAIPPQLLILELTEHQSLESLDAIAIAASRLALRGCGVAIDDFGRGTTSFERLLQLPISEVKIDRQIFLNCVEQSLSRPMLIEVIRFCRSHDIQCIVEGIETEQHRQLACDLGADFGQGFLWGKPKVPDYVLRGRRE